VATYYLIAVPVRIVYQPFSSMTQIELLGTDLLADVLVREREGERERASARAYVCVLVRVYRCVFISRDLSAGNIMPSSPM